VNFATEFFGDGFATAAKRLEVDLKIKHRLIFVRFKSESVWDHLDSSFLFPLETAVWRSLDYPFPTLGKVNLASFLLFWLGKSIGQMLDFC
jgi:hypothetical protein